MKYFWSELLPPWLTLCPLKQITLCTRFHIWGSIDRQEDQKREKSSNIFHIYTYMSHMHHSMCSLLLVCSVQVWYGQCWIWAKSMLKYELLTNWNIDYLYVPCLLLIKACTHKNVKIKKSETAKPVQKHSWRFPPKSIVQVEILKRMNFRFLFFLLISCPIKSSKSKLAPLRLSPMLQKVKIGKIWRWVYFVKDLQLLDQLHFGVTTYNDIYSWDVEQNLIIE